MLKIIFAASALLFATSSLSIAAIPTPDDVIPAQSKFQEFDQEADGRKLRMPGGSGCDSAQDQEEHADCRAATTSATENVSDQPIKEAKRRKKRIPGGSGCDSAHDRAEHPECR